jgi:hypothetical protein
MKMSLPDVGAELRRRAFEFIDLQVYCAQHAENVMNIHDVRYYLRHLEMLTHAPDAEWLHRYYGGSVQTWLAETADEWAMNTGITRRLHVRFA